MVILVGFYNAEKYIARSLASIMNQSYTDYTCYITHDLSTDESVDIVKSMIRDDARFILMPDNAKKLYQTGNFDTVIRNNPNISDDEVLVEVDGDDYLPDNDVLKRIKSVYDDSNIWIANGSFKYISGQIGFSKAQTNFDNLRTQQFTASHIRTWRAFLWRAINESDLRDDNGEYWQWSGDVCFMFPMLEMSGSEHYKFMPEINYVYNADNPINEHKVNMYMVTDHATKIRRKLKYQRLIR
jgi:glycosyltransferase involved in cell wall biosynthesis